MSTPRRQDAGRRSNRHSSRTSAPSPLIWFLVSAPVLALVLLGALVWWLLAPQPPAALPHGTGAADIDLRAIAALPTLERDQSSPFAVGWRMLESEEEFDLVVPVTMRLKGTLDGPHEGGGQMRQTSFGGSNADAAVGVVWQSFDGVDPARIDRALRTRPTLDPAADNSHLEVIEDEFMTFLGYPARRETLMVRFDRRVSWTEQITFWSDDFSLSVSLGADSETRPDWADRFFQTISIRGETSAELIPELQPRSGESIDLIPEVALYGDEVVGDWTREGGELTGSGAQALVTLPVVPPGAYQLLVEAKRESGSESLGIGFIAGGRQCRFGIDEYDGRRCGLTLLDDLTTLQQPGEVTDFGNLLGSDWNTITLTVLPKGGEYRIIGMVNDQIVLDWRGDPQRLSHADRYWQPPPDVPFLTIWENHLRFRRIELRDLTALTK